MRPYISPHYLNAEYVPGGSGSVGGSNGGLWSDFKTKDFLFGSRLYMIMGPFLLNGSGVVTGKIVERSRSNKVGWVKAKDRTISLSKSVTDYKKLLFVFSDEDGNEKIDNDCQIFFQEIDTEKYCWLNEIHIEREDLYERVKGMSKNSTLVVQIDGTSITYKYDTYRGALHNQKGYLYPYPNRTMVLNNEHQVVAPYFGYNPNYKNSIRIIGQSNFIVAIIGLK